MPLDVNDFSKAMYPARNQMGRYSIIAKGLGNLTGPQIAAASAKVAFLLYGMKITKVAAEAFASPYLASRFMAMDMRIFDIIAGVELCARPAEEIAEGFPPSVIRTDLADYAKLHYPNIEKILRAGLKSSLSRAGGPC